MSSNNLGLDKLQQQVLKSAIDKRGKTFRRSEITASEKGERAFDRLVELGVFEDAQRGRYRLMAGFEDYFDGPA